MKRDATASAASLLEDSYTCRLDTITRYVPATDAVPAAARLLLPQLHPTSVPLFGSGVGHKLTSLSDQLVQLGFLSSLAVFSAGHGCNQRIS